MQSYNPLSCARSFQLLHILTHIKWCQCLLLSATWRVRFGVGGSHTCDLRKFPGQGLNLSHSRILHRSNGKNSCLMISFFNLFFFSGPYLQHMELPRLELESELQPPAYTTTTATPDPSHVCNLHHSSWQHQNLNPLSEARD